MFSDNGKCFPYLITIDLSWMIEYSILVIMRQACYDVIDLGVCHVTVNVDVALYFNFCRFLFYKKMGNHYLLQKGLFFLDIIVVLNLIDGCKVLFAKYFRDSTSVTNVKCVTELLS